MWFLGTVLFPGEPRRTLASFHSRTLPNFATLFSCELLQSSSPLLVSDIVEQTLALALNQP